MRTSRLAGTGIKHFVVYPGLQQTPSPIVSSVCEQCCEVPMAWWNKSVYTKSVKRLASQLRTLQLTGLGYKTEHFLTKLIREWRIDIVHSNSAAVNAGALVARRLGIPHVWHIRERIGINGFMHFRMGDEALTSRIASLSCRVVPMSHFTGELFFRYGHDQKLQVVYDGVDRHLFDTDRSIQAGRLLRSKWGVPEKALLIGKVAAVTSRVKQHEIFIKTAAILSKRHPEVWFAIIGLLPGSVSWARSDIVSYFDRLKALVHECGISERFVWAGNILDTGAMMNAIDVLAHTCDLEGFGRVAIEAMAAGKPVVGPSAGGFTESVLDSVTGVLVPPRNPQAMSDALEVLITNPQIREEYGQAGRDRARKAFSPEQHLAAMRRVYMEALNN